VEDLESIQPDNGSMTIAAQAVITVAIAIMIVTISPVF
jgi:hypothetical protein